MLKSQGDGCALCLAPIKFNGKVKPGSAIVDHDHDSGRVRGVICNRCNILMAQMDAGVTLDRLSEYLGVAQSG